MLKRFCQLSQSNHDNQARSIPPEGLFESRLLSSQKKSANDLALNCQAQGLSGNMSSFGFFSLLC